MQDVIKKLKFKDSGIVLNAPKEIKEEFIKLGMKITFDKKTNMRRYEAVSVLPIDLYYALALFKIDKIRLQYKSGIKRTVSLFIEQQKKFQQIIRCVGENPPFESSPLLCFNR